MRGRRGNVYLLSILRGMYRSQNLPVQLVGGGGAPMWWMSKICVVTGFNVRRPVAFVWRTGDVTSYAKPIDFFRRPNSLDPPLVSGCSAA